MTTSQDQIANAVLQQLSPAIVGHINVNEIILLLHARNRLTANEVNELESLGDAQKPMKLYLKALANKGLPALNDFIEVLQETGHYQPHIDLVTKLETKFHDLQQSGGIRSNSWSSGCRQHGNQRQPTGRFVSLQTGLPDIVQSEEQSQPDQCIQCTRLTSSLPTPVERRPMHSVPADNRVLKVSPGQETSHVSSSINNDELVTVQKQPSPAASGKSHQLFTLDEDVSTEQQDSQTGSHSACTPHCHCRSNLTDLNESPTIIDTACDSGIVASGSKQSGTVTTTTAITTKGNELPGAVADDHEMVYISVLNKSAVPLPDMISLKLILLGNSGVGKTSLVERFLKNAFTELSPVTVGSTHGTCYAHHVTRHKNIKLAVWDTAGQETYNWITPGFYRGASVVLIVFDMTDPNRISLRAVANWRQQLLNNISDQEVPMLLVGNKCDSQIISENIREHAEHVVRRLGLNGFIEASAKDGHQVEDVFERASTLALDHYSPHSQEAIILGNEPREQPTGFCERCKS